MKLKDTSRKKRRYCREIKTFETMTNSKKVKENVKHLTRQNFRAYPEDWENGDIFLRDLAHGYWETRRDNEIERDENLGITEEDYYDFVSEANDEICEEQGW